MTPEPRDCAVREFGALVAEKAAEDRIVEQRIARHCLDARGIDVDDRRPRLLHHRREGEAHGAEVLGNRLLAFRRDGRSEGGGEDEEHDGEGAANHGQSRYFCG